MKSLHTADDERHTMTIGHPAPRGCGGRVVKVSRHFITSPPLLGCEFKTYVGQCPGSGSGGALGQEVVVPWVRKWWCPGSGSGGALGQEVVVPWARNWWYLGSGRGGALGQEVVVPWVRKWCHLDQ
ncbi:hypothetical protein CI610_03275 [invertebrate metagenome]|uniref:Uncharacterized protein n=1 Tax=invertebrate metagenome TaxID=1711999 RepID=A0A2H9T3I7_9ZZZZ